MKPLYELLDLYQGVQGDLIIKKGQLEHLIKCFFLPFYIVPIFSCLAFYQLK
jgi:hypothetical protein